MIEAGLYLVLALIAVWPLPCRFRSELPLGSEPCATVPLLNVWTVWWNAESARRCFRGYWDAPIFHPVARVLAFSEPMTPTVVAAPLVWSVGDAVCAYNLLLVLALALNGWTGFRLLRRLRLGWTAAVWGGAMIELLPLVHGKLGVFQLVPLCGILWTLHALYNFAQRPTAGRALLGGAAFAFTYLLCAYYGLFLSVLLLVAAGWLLGRKTARGRMWLAAAPGIVLAALLIAPAVLVQRQVIAEHQFARPLDWLEQLSAQPGDYLAAPWPPWLPFPRWEQLARGSSFQLYPGFVKLLLALVGGVAGLRARHRRGWTAGCGAILIAAFLLSLGPGLRIGEWAPYRLLVGFYPGFAQARNVYRFAIFVQLMLALLAARGLSSVREMTVRYLRGASFQLAADSGIASWKLTLLVSRTVLGAAARRLVRWPRAARAPWAVQALVVGLGLCAVLETWPPSPPRTAVPDAGGAWIPWLRHQTPHDAVIACVPFPTGTSDAAYAETAVWMYWQTHHGRRMVNGYSGFFPDSFLQLKEAMARFPDSQSLELLERCGVEYCVVSRACLVRRAVTARADLAERLVWVFGDDQAGMDVYQLRLDGR